MKQCSWTEWAAMGLAAGALVIGGCKREASTGPICGDGRILGSEVCDDGNIDPGDGCDDQCNVEAGWDCLGEPSVCAALADCGNGTLDATAGEECDDGTGNSDTTPNACRTNCTSPLCGDAVTDDGPPNLEECDPPDGVSCDSACQLITPVTCGDGLIAGLEECDDSNIAGGDGCDDTCLVEAGWQCAGAPSTCSAICGDGIILGAEGCDDTGTATGDGCDDTCQVETGWSCTGEPSVCVTTCGDSIPAGLEECDDGANGAGDGCDDSCLVEFGYVCTGTPSVCTVPCGDSIVGPGEDCDPPDGATCDAACAYIPQDDGGPCTIAAQCLNSECLDEATLGYPGGFCSTPTDCQTTPCAAGSACYWVDRAQTVARCIPECTGQADCRTGYGCWDLIGPGNPPYHCRADCDDDPQCPDTGTCNPYTGLCEPLVGLVLDGQACATDADCESGQCIEAATSPAWTGGYCVSSCTTALNNCPGDGFCSSQFFPNELFGICIDGCTTTADCRQGEGYDCFPIEGGPDTACLPVLPTGSPCTADAQCQGGLCLDEATYGYPGGYCTETIDCATTLCPAAGMGCFVVDPAAPTVGRCFAQCADQSQCRPGYGCWDQANPGAPPFHCRPDCHLDSQCFAGAGLCVGEAGLCGVDQNLGRDGAACTVNNQCESNFCIPADAAGPGTFPLGYCSSLCTNALANCPGDGACGISLVGPTLYEACADGCTTNADCRQADGYTCQTFGTVQICWF